MKHFLFYFLFIILCSPLAARHIWGGTISYENLGAVSGGVSYQINVELFRDCSIGSANFDIPAIKYLCIYKNSDNSLLMNIDVPMVGSPINVDSFLLCIEAAQYTTNVILPASSEGYTIVWKRCCRTGTISNIETPGDVGFVLYMIIPATNILNKSPELSNLYPSYGNIAQFQHNIIATDADNDSVTYQLTAAQSIASATADDPIPVCELSLTNFMSLPFTPGFSLQNILSSNTPLTINAEGQLNAAGIPIGIFVFGITTRDYRNGQLISSAHSELSTCIINGFVGINNTASQVPFYLSPNPAANVLEVSLAKEDIKEYEIYSLAGKRLDNGKDNRIDVSSLAAGIYILHIETKKGIGRQFFVKE